MKVSVTVRVRTSLDGSAGVGAIGSNGSAASSDGTSISTGGEKSISFPSYNTNSFTFDNIFGGTASQEEVFDTAAKPLVVDALNGVNCTLFTYGQTGSGKTYTMQGVSGVGVGAGVDDRGIVPRTADMMLTELERRKSDNEITSYEFKLSVLEIYKERLFDLLSSSSNAGKDGNSRLRIREHLGSVWVDGLVEQQCGSSGQFADLLVRASRRRKVGAHAMNASSSRSHLVVIINVKQSHPSSAQGNVGKKVSSKLYLIDLAGSEMVKKTDAAGVRLAEAKSINSSLSALGKVIHALTMHSCADGTSSKLSNPHVPYRDSKLTRLLQDSLGGNARTSLLLAVSPEVRHLSETVATLRFGERAKFLQTRPLVNAEVVIDETYLRSALMAANKQIVTLNVTVTELQQQICALLRSSSSSSLGTGVHLVCTVCHSVKRADDQKSIDAKPTMSKASDDDNDRQFLKLPAIVAAPTPTVSVKVLPPQSPAAVAAEPQQHDTVVVGSGDTVAPADGASSDDDDDEMQLCIVCGLGDEATIALREETGEWLGELFACDGNCGGKFHTRCVGVDSDGFSTAIDGEWLCSTCTAGCSFGDDNRVGHNDSSSRDDGTTATDMITTALLSPVHHLTSPLAAIQGSSLNIVNDSTHLKAEYHAMRIERNRVLAQWQQEKRVAAVMEKKRMAMEKQRDLDLIVVSEENARLKIDIENSKNELARLQEIHDNFLIEKKAITGDSSSSYQYEHSGHRSRVSERLSSLLNDAAFPSLMSSHGGVDEDVDNGQRRSGAPNVITESELEASINARVARSNSNSSSSVVSNGKIWKTVDKKKVTTNTTTIPIHNIPSNYSSNINSKLTKDSDLLAADGLHSCDGGYTREEYERYYSYDRLEPQLIIVPAVSSNNDPTVMAASSPVATAARPAPHLGANPDPDPEGVSPSAYEDSLYDSRVSSSRYLDPLKNRLNDLLKSAQEEKVSFLEIRQKYGSKKEVSRDRERASTRPPFEE